MKNEKNEKNENYSCEYCKFICKYKSDWQRHTQSVKHFNNYEAKIDNIIDTSLKIYQCEYCSFNCKTRSGLWKHKKKCNIDNNIPKNQLDDYINEAVSDAIKDAIKSSIQNNDDKQHELMMQIIKNQGELQTVIKEIVKTGIMTNSHNTINSHNKTFNLHMYLNETCKDAMNLSEFINKIVPTIEELEKTAREGYVRGVTNIVTTRLDEVDKHIQPIHCTDGKREVLYIKENDVWNKEEGDNKPLLLKAIKSVATKNICNISEWIKLYPDCTQSDSCKNDLYLKIMLNSMSGGSEEECKTNYEKVVSGIAKHTIIEKNIISN